jgi:predicted nucleic acid-binding protein
VIIDTGVMVAAYDDRDPDHDRVKAALLAHNGPMIVSPYVIAEADYLILDRHGVATELAMLRDLHGGAWDLAGFDKQDLSDATAVLERYDDREIGITDASIVVLAKRHRTKTVATLDHRHFEMLRPLDGGHFTIVPD